MPMPMPMPSPRYVLAATVKPNGRAGGDWLGQDTLTGVHVHLQCLVPLAGKRSLTMMPDVKAPERAGCQFSIGGPVPN
jgi:hypothetical protein